MDWKKLAMRATLVVLWSAIIGLAYNQFSVAKMPLFRSHVSHNTAAQEPASASVAQQPQPTTNPYESKDLTIDEAFTLFKTKGAIFIDGRSESQYKNKHIKGAMSVYFRNAETNPALQDIKKDQVVVTYCISARCAIAHKLATSLMKMGYKNVYVFPGGMEEWTKAQYPVEAG